MLSRLRSHKLSGLATLLLLSSCALAWFVLTPAVSSQSAPFLPELNQHFRKYQRLTLDAPAAVQQVRATGRLSLTSQDLSFELELVPHDMRSADYRAEEFDGSGIGKPVDTGAVTTYRGEAHGTESGESLPQVGEARFTIDEKGIEGLIITPSEHYFVEPALNYSKSSMASDYIIYKASDVVANSLGECGVTLSEQVTQRLDSLDGENPKHFKTYLRAGAVTDDLPTIPSPPKPRERSTPKSIAGDLFAFQGSNRNSVWQEKFDRSASQERDLVRAPSGPNDACSGEPITGGQQLNRVLGPGCAFPGGQYAGAFTFEGTAGQQAAINMSSTAFDSNLYLFYGPAQTFVAFDDNGGGGTNSRIPAGSGFLNLPATATYIIYASSAAASQTGPYTIGLLFQPPPNDNFVDSELLFNSSGNLSRSNVGATKESGEPNHAGVAGGASIWFEWLAAANGPTTFATTGSDFDTVLAIYTGTGVGTLTSVGSNNNDPNAGAQSRVVFNAVAGTTYLIAVDGVNASTGNLKLNWNPPGNDDFVNAQTIIGAFGTVSGSNRGATKQTGEPNHAGDPGGASVWYRWQASANGTATFTTKTSNFDTILGVYTGASVNSLGEIAGNDDIAGAHTSRVTFNAISGTTYYIAVDGFNNPPVRTGNVTLNWTLDAATPPPPPPANDNFDHPQILSGILGTVTGSSLSASKQGGEPDHGGRAGGASVWYRWQAPGSGLATFETTGSHFDTVLGIYIGSTVGSLTGIGSNDDMPSGGVQSSVTFSALFGRTYYIAVDGDEGAAGAITLKWTFPDAPPNNNFANAQQIAGVVGTFVGSNAGSNKEVGEPNHAGYLGGASVWYSWQALTTGATTFTTVGSNFDTLLGVYVGPNLGSLINISSNDDTATTGPQSSVTFSTVSGTIYYIAVDGYDGAFGNIGLNWAPDSSTPSPSPTPSATPTPIPVSTLRELRVATEADHEFVVSKGDSAAANRAILSIMNQVEGIYELELGLTLKVSYQSAWNTENQPYGSINPSTLLSELTNYWNSNRGTVSRDLVHLWTGKPLENAGIGAAYLEALCRYGGSGRAAYGLSKSVQGIQQIAITAHEIGHNLGATHPNQQQPPILECTNTIMSSSSSVNPQLDFCQFSIDEVSRYLANNTSCLSLGPSQLSFAVSKHFSLDHDAQALAAGDFNDDGKSDLAVAYDRGVTILLGTDNGGFLTPITLPVASSPRAIGVGDFDENGKQDLVLANYETGTISVLLGNGSGTFQTTADYPAGKLPNGFAIADYNGDNHQDLAVVSAGTSGVTVLLSAGAGGFQTPISYPAGANTSRIVGGDFNADGKQDVVVSYVGNFYNGGLRVMLGTGDGGFQAPTNHTPFLATVPLLSVGDFNNDGIDDVVAVPIDNVTDPSLPTLFRVLLGSPSGFQGTFSGGSSGLRHVHAATCGDFNADGRQDLVLAGDIDRPGDNGFAIVIGNGTGSFNSPAYYNVEGNLTGLAAGDFNGDGKQDVLGVGKQQTASVAVLLLGSGVGVLEAPLSRELIFPTSIAAGDFNADGKQDLAYTSTYDPFGSFTGEKLSVILGTGTGEFSSTFSEVQFGLYLNGVAAGDFNNDGKLDLAVVLANEVQYHGGLKVLIGTGTGFQSPLTYSAGAYPVAVAGGDFNNDGKIDLVAVNGIDAAGDITLIPGTGTGSFQPAITLVSLSSYPSGITACDFNLDGNLDLAVTYRNSDQVSVFLGAGAAGLHQPVNFLCENGAATVTSGDFNGDHKPDIAVGGVRVLLGMGDGSFKLPVNFGGGGIAGVAGADFNGDGKIDIAAASGNLHPLDSGNNGSVSVLLNSSGHALDGPSNDSFSAARAIRGQRGSLPGNSVLATIEPNEPNHASASNGTGGASIWYRWTAPSTGKFYFQTFSSSFPSVLAVYTGSSVGALTSLVKSTSSVPEYVEFNATAGATYQIAIDGVTGDTGRTVLNWNTGSLQNDNFAFAREIRGSNGSVNGNNTNFTLEAGEPTLPGAANTGFSAWYRWTAPNTGKVTFSTSPCGDTTRLLGAYTGNFLDTLTLVAVNYDGYRDVDDPNVCDNRTLRFNAVAGTTYRIQMRSVAGKAFTLNWNYADPPPNDNFVNALVLAGGSGSVVGTNRDATKETGEPNHAGGSGGASVWYRWTATASGQTTFDAIGFKNQSGSNYKYLTALMAVYTGSAINSLTQVVASSSGNSVTFNATAGTTYQIAVDSAPSGVSYLPGFLPLHWGPKAIPNDNFTNAQVVTAAGSFSPQLGSNVGATKEPGEPNHRGFAGRYFCLVSVDRHRDRHRWFRHQHL